MGAFARQGCYAAGSIPVAFQLTDAADSLLGQQRNCRLTLRELSLPVAGSMTSLSLPEWYHQTLNEVTSEKPTHCRSAHRDGHQTGWRSRPTSFGRRQGDLIAKVALNNLEDRFPRPRLGPKSEGTVQRIGERGSAESDS
jgi:hypothetical protein